MLETVWRVYKITSPDTRAYIGITSKTVRWRFKRHTTCAVRGRRGPLYDAMRVFGVSNFKVETLTECFSSKETAMTEKAMIASHDTYFWGGNGFNMNLGGGGLHSSKISDATRKLASERMKKIIEADPLYTKRMSDIATSKAPSQAQIEARIENGRKCGLLGRSIASREKQSRTTRGRKKSPEHAKALAKNLKKATEVRLRNLANARNSNVI